MRATAGLASGSGICDRESVEGERPVGLPEGGPS
jgi:hypothetical protein